ncbi:TPA: hypothetical protein ACH3X2_004267 [Trebouxia sp. C0005]
MRMELFESSHNVALFLHRLNTERMLRNWNDSIAILEASANMTDIPLMWFVTQYPRPEDIAATTWVDFDAAMRRRFGDNEQTIVSRIQQRKQQDDEPVQAYLDDMMMLLAQSTFPETLKIDFLLENMHHGLSQDVIKTIPTTVEEVVFRANFIEDKSLGINSNRVKNLDRQSKRRNYKEEDVAELARAFGKLSVAFADSKPGNRHQPNADRGRE